MLVEVEVEAKKVVLVKVLLVELKNINRERIEKLLSITKVE